MFASQIPDSGQVHGRRRLEPLTVIRKAYAAIFFRERSTHRQGSKAGLLTSDPDGIGGDLESEFLERHRGIFWFRVRMNNHESIPLLVHE